MPCSLLLRRFLPLFLLLGLTGCVYLRLLEVKNQLNEFDRFFRVQIVDGAFTIRALNPVILSDDFTYLTKLNPSRVDNLPDAVRWHLDFRTAGTAADSKSARTISFNWTFNRDKKLSVFGYSPLFLEIAPPAFLEASIRSIGKGKVDKARNQLKVDPEDLPKLTEHPPSRTKILEALGEPQEKSIKDDLLVLKYRLVADAKPVDPDYEDRRNAEVKLSFDRKTDELAKLSGRFVGLKLSIDYRKLIAQPPRAKTEAS